MFTLWASIKKDWLILIRDKMGLLLMFMMPVVLAIVIAMVQNSTYELVNDKKVPILVLNRDSAEAADMLERTLENGSLFIIKKVPAQETDSMLKVRMQNKEALLAIVIPARYTNDVSLKAENVSAQALQVMSAMDDTSGEVAPVGKTIMASPITLYYHPVLQASFRQGIQSALNSVLQIVQSKYIVRQLYSGINHNATIPDSLEQQILANETPIHQYSVSKDNSTHIPNATQHNIPAWTLFAMFFIVISLGSSIVREKNSGSFLRLKTMPAPLSLSLLSRQITYVTITIMQAVLIFSIGRWFFPIIGLPALNFPTDMAGLVLVVVICGWCATSFAICIGVFANTQEQSNGIGAISIVLFAAIGGLLVPAFAMPSSFQPIMRLSPMYWCLEAFYGLFLEGGKFKDILTTLFPIFIIILVLQLSAWWGMYRQKYV